MENNKSKKTWWERNKKKVRIVGGVVVAVGIGVVVYKNKDAIVTLLNGGKMIKGNVKPVTKEILINTTESIPAKSMINNGLPFEVKGFIRNLPKGYKPSDAKVCEALKMGIVLGENQTFVVPYLKNAA